MKSLESVTRELLARNHVAESLRPIALEVVMGQKTVAEVAEEKNLNYDKLNEEVELIVQQIKEGRFKSIYRMNPPDISHLEDAYSLDEEDLQEGGAKITYIDKNGKQHWMVVFTAQDGARAVKQIQQAGGRVVKKELVKEMFEDEVETTTYRVRGEEGILEQFDAESDEDAVKYVQEKYAGVDHQLTRVKLDESSFEGKALSAVKKEMAKMSASKKLAMADRITQYLLK